MRSNRIASRLKRKAAYQTELDFYGNIPEWDDFYRSSGIEEIIHDLNTYEDCVEDGGSTTLQWYQDAIRHIQRFNRSLNDLLATVRQEFRSWAGYMNKSKDLSDQAFYKKDIKPYL